ncbi:MAG: acyl-CoA synthetase [Planctomycetes bacterium]|nr:acyl-CoA synthetase [Planctomycetota bacterium]
MRTLRDWLVLEAAESRHGARVLCGRGTGVLDSARFLEDVARLVGALRGEPRGRWVLCTESAWACAVGLFALWQHGSVAVMPPNLEPGTLAELLPSAAGCLADRPLEAPPAGPAPRRVPILADGPREGPAAHPSPVRAPFRTLDHAAPAVELCTSGSTGNRKTVSKTLTQLEAEIEALEHQFGASLGGARVLGTVSFQHIYGLLFRVLWPLCAGRTFADGTVVDPALLEHAFAGGERGVLVGSPAHLKRLPELLDLGQLRGPCVEVFSSGGALDEATAARFGRELGFSPLEVLGSTETGGIAWRRQGPGGGPAWSPFPGVAVEARDGLLTVTSKPAGDPHGVPTGDAIELLPGGAFLLLGRADRIVKLFDERVSLAELELRLCAHPAVAAAAALTLERTGTVRIAAAVVPSAAGRELLGSRGKTGLASLLRTHLQSFFRATALPRAWRFVDRLPEDAQGKVGLGALRALFAPEPGGGEPAQAAAHAGPLEAKVLAVRERGPEALELELEVPADLWCMRGHFDGFPVVPGVVQLQWVLDWARQWSGADLPLRGIEALKFKQILVGKARFRLRLEHAADPAKVRFRLWNEAGEFSSGRVIFATAAPAPEPAPAP